MTEAVTTSGGAHNGTVAPTLPPELAEYPAMLTAVMEQTRQQLDARDASAEQHMWYWHRFALWQGAVLVAALVLVAWLIWDRRHVQAFVQVVQETDEGRLVQIGVPQHLMDYTPPEAAWHDLMAEWLRRVHWRGGDLDKAEKVDWRWVELHTCPSARPFLAAYKDREKPFKKTATRVQVNIRTITKTPTPKSYQVLWEQVATGLDSPKGQTAKMTTTFTVGRMALKTLGEAEDNRLGVCVASFDTYVHSD